MKYAPHNPSKHDKQEQNHLKKTRFRKNDLYRYSRMLHAYLSAFAFLTLIFFALTGLFLNHPDWFRGNKTRTESLRVTLPSQEMAAILKTPSHSQALIHAISQHTDALRGVFKSDDTIDDEAHIHLEGVTGKTDIITNLKSGLTEITVEKATLTSIIQDLHRGKNSGQAWRLLIDITAIIVLTLSLIGYVIFFSIRLRLATSLALTAFSCVLFVGIFFIFVP